MAATQTCLYNFEVAHTMITISNPEKSAVVGFDFLNTLPDDFDSTESKFEKCVPFILNIATSDRVLAITEDMHANMTVFEIERIYYGISGLLDCVGSAEDKRFSHYSSESFFEIILEYLYEDDLFILELWFFMARHPEGKLNGYYTGFKFGVERSEVVRFVQEYRDRFNAVCPHCATAMSKTLAEDELHAQV
jgi:hypothetical protein